MNKKIVILFSIAVMLLISGIAETIFYYNEKVNVNNSQISSLNIQIANQNSQIANLTGQIEHFNAEAANLTTYLTISEVPNATSPLKGVLLEYDSLSINGTVVNTGNLTAYDAGLKVLAYSANDTLEINMTIPLVCGEGGNAAPLTTYVSGYIMYFGTNNATQANANIINSFFGNNVSLQLGDLGGGQTAPVDIDIIHEGIVANWTVTTVWINST